MDETEKTLAFIKVGECLTVRAISGNASARLFDLGFSPKAEIRCLGTALGASIHPQQILFAASAIILLLLIIFYIPILKKQKINR